MIYEYTEPIGVSLEFSDGGILYVDSPLMGSNNIQLTPSEAVNLASALLRWATKNGYGQKTKDFAVRKP